MSQIVSIGKVETYRTRRLVDFREVRQSGRTLLRYVVLMYGPGGEVFDLTDRLSKNGIGKIVEAVEEDFLELTHGDMAITLRNDDGAIDRFFRHLAPGDLYEITVERDAPSGRLHFERLFGGILDLPWSLRFDRVEKTASVQVFSYSKLLERISGETVRRPVTGMTGQATAAGVTVSNITPNTSELHPGDDLKLTTSLGLTETQTIRQITNSTSVVITASWSNTFAAGTPMEVATPYHRDRSVSFIAGEIFDAAGVTSQNIDATTPISEYPIATPMAKSDYDQPSTLGIVKDATFLSVRSNVITSQITPTQKFTATRPDSLWVYTAGAVTLISDWTPYYETEPANFPLLEEGSNDDGEKAAADHENNRKYSLLTFGSPYTGVNFRRDTGTVNVVIVIGGTATTTVYTSQEYCPDTDHVWVSITGKTADAWDFVRVYDVAGALVATVETTRSGKLRYLRRLGLMVLHERDMGATGGGARTTNLHLYNASTRAFMRTVQVPVDLAVWSLRVFDLPGGERWIVGIYSDTPNQTTRVRLWDDQFVEKADYKISDRVIGSSGLKGYVTIWKDPVTAIEYPIIATSGELLVLAKGYAGVVPYADFDGLSCGGAIKELALATLTYATVDPYKAGSLQSRLVSNALRRARPIDLDAPIRHTSWPLWEFYRTSAEINGTDATGVAFSVIRGTTGDSQHRISLDSKIVATTSLAEIVAEAYSALLSRKVTQEEVEVNETGTPIHVLDYVRLSGIVYLVIESTYSPTRRTYSLRLVEAP